MNCFFSIENYCSYYGSFVRVGRTAGHYTATVFQDTNNKFVTVLAITGYTGYLGHKINSDNAVVKKIYEEGDFTVTSSSVAPFKVIKNNMIASISTMDGSTISDTPLTALTWATNVRNIGVIDANVSSSTYVMAPVSFQSGPDWYNGAARIFYSGRVDLWCPISLSAYIPYLNISLPLSK